MDSYNLINSKAVSEHCRKIKHQFNTEELAVLIYRNKRMSIEEKTLAYQELIEKYPDMEVIERINCQHYDSVKDMIQQEIQRMQNLKQEMQKQDENMLYTYDTFYRFSESFEESENYYKTYADVCNAVAENIKEDDDLEIMMYKIKKRSFIRNERQITEEYILDSNRNIKQIYIYDSMEFTDLDGICLNIPTPFKRGDILVSNMESPLDCRTFYHKKVFVLDWLCNFEDYFQEMLNKGSHDSSDMNGMGYYVSKDDTIYLDHLFNYDEWEYFEGELKESGRILKAISSLVKNEISIDLFLEGFKYIMAEQQCKNCFSYSFTDEGLKLVGLNDKDINNVNH